MKVDDFGVLVFDASNLVLEVDDAKLRGYYRRGGGGVIIHVVDVFFNVKIDKDSPGDG